MAVKIPPIVARVPIVTDGKSRLVTNEWYKWFQSVVAVAEAGANGNGGDGGGAPAPHAPTHYGGGSDPVDIKELAGYPNSATVFLRGDGTFDIGPVGPAGPTGVQGATGPQGPIGATGPASTVPGPAGPAGPQGTQGAQGAQGAQGIPGAGEEWYIDAVPPGGPEFFPQAVVGDTYLNTTNGNVYEKTAEPNTWTLKGNIKGPAGTTGAQGAQGPQGVKGDTGATGATGSQGPQGIQGPIGPDGPVGPEGPQGAALEILGTLPNAGALPPVGAPGDAWIAADTGHLWVWDADTSTWVDAGQITGPPGPQGPQGQQGVQGVPGTQGVQGVKGDTGATGATGAQGIQGVPGPEGPKGDTGATGPAGSNATLPTDALGKVLISQGAGVQPVYSPDPKVTTISLGVIPAQSGALRLGNDSQIVARNAANTADMSIIHAYTDNTVYVGPNTAGQSLILRSGAGAAVGVAGDLIAANVDTGGHVAVGATPAQSGALRLANNQAIVARNGANAYDLTMLHAFSGDAIQLGGANVSMTYVGNANGVTVSGPLTAPSVAIGSTPAQSGALRLANSAPINWRDAGNGYDIGIYMDGAPSLRTPTIMPQADDAYALGYPTLRWLYGCFSTNLQIGTNPATFGAIRLANNSAVVARNVTNAGNVQLIQLDAGNNIVVGHLGISPLYLDSNATIYLRPGGGGSDFQLGSSAFLPGTDNVAQFGSAAKRWLSAYFSGTILAEGGLGATPLNATNLLSGTIPDARLSVNVLKYTGGYPGGTATYLRADGTFATVPISGGAPGAHKATHEPGGSDPLTVDAVATTGSLRTLGTGANQAAAGNDTRLTNARTPLAHATTHNYGGTDQLNVQNLAGYTANATVNFLRQDGNFAEPPGGTLPGLHHTTHESGGNDVVTVNVANISGTLNPDKGGMGIQVPIANGDMLVGSSPDYWIKLPKPSVVPRYLAFTSAGASLPQWTQIDLQGTGITGILPGTNIGAHRTSHQSAGGDPLDVKLLAGFPSDATKFLSGAGTFVVPPYPAIPSNIAFTNVANVFTVTPQTINAVSPTLKLYDPSAAVDQRSWVCTGGSTAFIIQPLTDAGGGTSVQPLSFYRTGDLTVPGTLRAPRAILTGDFPQLQIDHSIYPIVQFNETGQPADAKKTRMWHTGGSLRFECMNDAETGVMSTPLVLNRDGSIGVGGDLVVGRYLQLAGRTANNPSLRPGVGYVYPSAVEFTAADESNWATCRAGNFVSVGGGNNLTDLTCGAATFNGATTINSSLTIRSPTLAELDLADTTSGFTARVLSYASEFTIWDGGAKLFAVNRSGHTITPGAYYELNRTTAQGYSFPWTPPAYNHAGSAVGGTIYAHFSIIGKTLFWSIYCGSFNNPGASPSIRFTTPPGYPPAQASIEMPSVRCYDPVVGDRWGFCDVSTDGFMRFYIPGINWGAGVGSAIGQGFYFIT